MIDRFDSWLSKDGPVALTITESLEPAIGEQAVFFPPTFAAPEGSDEKPNYVIDANRVCLVDTVGSQANRLEPIFKRSDLRPLTPKFTVKVGLRTIDLLDAGHRSADAVVRFSDKWDQLHGAFIAYRDMGNAEPLARLAPTSLVFGAWDSRDTGAKVPRVVESIVRAYEAERLSRSAQYFAVLEKDEIAQLGLDTLNTKDLSEHGLLDSPSGKAPGGVIAKKIQREALLNLVALRSIGAADLEPADKENATITLQRYILGLSLVAFIAPTQLYLRQGCLLVAKDGEPSRTKLVWRSGKKEDQQLSEAEVIAYAKEAAKQFKVGDSIEAVFDPARVKSKVEEKAAKKAKKK